MVVATKLAEHLVRKLIAVSYINVFFLLIRLCTIW